MAIPKMTRESLIGGTILIFAIFGLLAFMDHRKKRRVQAAWAEGRRPDRKDMDNQTSWGLMIISAVALFIVAISRSVFEHRFADLSAETQAFLRDSWNWLMYLLRVVLLFAGILLALVVAAFWIIYALMTSRSRKDVRYQKVEALALEGNVTAAIDVVREILGETTQDGATAKKLTATNYLSALEAMQGNWPEALALVDRLEFLARSQLLFAGIKGLAVWKTGHLVDAEDCLRSRVQANPSNPFDLTAYGLYLADVGRIAEATEALHKLDGILAKLPEKGSALLEKAVEYLRLTIHGRDGSQDASDASSGTICDIGLRVVLLSSVQDVIFCDPARVPFRIPRIRRPKSGAEEQRIGLNPDDGASQQNDRPI